jgi:hypothetical protein
MRPSTLYKGYQAQLAARETARQRMLATAWEIEEAERFIAFLDAIHVDNEDRLKFTEERLDSLRGLFSERNHAEVDDDRDYLQAVYEDELEILKTVSSQAEHVSKVLGSRVGKAFQSGVKRPRFPSSQSRVIDNEADVSKASARPGVDGSGSPTASGCRDFDDDDDPIYPGTFADYSERPGFHKASYVATAS